MTSSVSFTLPQNIERLVLAGGSSLSGTGNGLANSIIGNGANNLLRGNGGADSLSGGEGSDRLQGGDGQDRLFGGLGNDILRGDAGADLFYFNTPIYNTINFDRIEDFNPAEEFIYLSRSIFETAGPAGTLSGDAFHAGTAAAHWSDRIIYDQAAGKLYYDPDGPGGTEQALFATVDPGTALTAADFILYG